MSEPVISAKCRLRATGASSLLNLLYAQLTEYNVRLPGASEFRLELQSGAHDAGELGGPFSPDVDTLGDVGRFPAVDGLL